jgi:hypothetical protein
LIDQLHEFAKEAAQFEKWAMEPHQSGAPALRQALIHITRLYLAALQLSRRWADDVEDKSGMSRVAAEDVSKIIASASLPIDMYGEIFNPLIVPPEDPVIGSITDDVISIYRDVVTGLRAYQRGDLSNARWEWGFSFAHHWGRHATGAIRTLHIWLAVNAIDELAEVRDRAGSGFA